MKWFGILLVLLLAGCTAAQPSIDESKKIVLDSYQLFEERGVTEELSNEEGDWTLVFDPSLSDYQAAWFDVKGEGELIFETDYFSVFVAYLMLSDRGLETQMTTTGFSMKSENWAQIDFVVQNGLIVGASSEEFEPWSSKISYLVSKDSREKIAELEKKVVAGLSENS
jgi:hypothetical protein